jgi:hypothetical protein
VTLTRCTARSSGAQSARSSHDNNRRAWALQLAAPIRRC